MDIEVFKLLKSQSIGVFGLLFAVREFAATKELYNDVERLNADIAESKHILSLTNSQLAELITSDATQRLGFFDTINIS